MQQSDIQCRVGTEVDSFNNPAYRVITFLTAGTVTIAGTPPALNEQIVFTRSVDFLNLIHDYQNGAIITEQNLNESDEQLLMLIQELLDGKVCLLHLPSSLPSDAVTQTQLTASIANLQSQIDAINASIAGITASTIAAVQAQIDSQIATALATQNLKSGDRLLQHLYTSNSSTSQYTTTLPSSGPPTTADGTQVLTLTITPTTIGNTINIRSVVPIASNSSQFGASLFINNTFVTSDWTKITYGALIYKEEEVFDYDYIATSLSPIVISINIGVVGGTGLYTQINDSVAGGEVATLVVEEIGQANPGLSIDITTLAYTGKVGNTLLTDPFTSLIFKPDGTEVYFADTSSPDIWTFTLNTPWDISTLHTPGISSNYLSASSICSLAISPDGLTVYTGLTGSPIINEFYLGTAWDISTGTNSGFTLDITAQTGSGKQVAYMQLSPDRTKLYILAQASSLSPESTGVIYQYTLGTPGEINTATYSGLSYTLTQLATEQGLFVFSSDGSTLFTATINNGAGASIYQYRLDTPFNISTTVYTGKSKVVSGTILQNGEGMYLKSDGSTLYIGTLNPPFEIYEYSLT